jgi:hypothetical protein
VRVVSQERLGTILSALPGVPRVVAGGNYATPWPALAMFDAAVAEYRSSCSTPSRGVHGLIYSGFGGQTDFVVGALHSPGGEAIIALPSWHPKANVSTVVPRLVGPLTSFQHSFIASDQGTAAVWGHDASAQAEQIITQVAHPSVRDQLRDAGRELGFRV